MQISYRNKIYVKFSKESKIWRKFPIEITFRRKLYGIFSIGNIRPNFDSLENFFEIPIGTKFQ